MELMERQTTKMNKNAIIMMKNWDETKARKQKN